MPKAKPASDSGPKRILDPLDRSSEVLFGLIMALTFTSTFEVATVGRAHVRTMLIGALGCNLAWGIVDGVMFVVTRSVERSRFHSKIRAVQTANAKDAARILEEERDLFRAARVSDATALVMLFAIGTALGRQAWS
jgi:hypothetical protein